MEYLLSAGIDIGTTTTHLVISRIGIAVERGWGTVPKAEIKEKTILYQSPIYFTPLADGQIDLPRVQTIIHLELKKAGTTPGALNTGAVILTGESVKKRNARRVAGTVADGMGDFVVASAGPRLESILAARGAGADTLSATRHCKVLHADIGGGTANLAFFDNGTLQDTACLEIGGRHWRADKGIMTPTLGTLLTHTHLSADDHPAIDTVESTTAILNLFNDVKNGLGIPTQICVLSHITTQMQALQNGAPMDLLFQSIAGSEKGLSAFGTGVNMLAEAKQMTQELGTSQGPNQLYFETGQGSELSSSSHNGADQVTMESRCYGLARHFSPYLVNTVVGFIGPEYIYDSKQLTRAALEDNFCGHLHGLPMGCDICYTNHMVADQNDADNLLVLLANAGCHYVIGVPQSDDVMLMYQSTSYHDVAATWEMLGLHPIPEFERWCEDHGILENGKLTPLAGQPGLLM